MWLIYLDPSSWIKHYFAEQGSANRGYLLSLAERTEVHFICSRIGLPEVVSVAINPIAFQQAYRQLRNDCRNIRLLSVKNKHIDLSIRFLLLHNLNATDALHLQVALETLQNSPIANSNMLMVSSDQRLLRASQSEGLPVFNPETDNIASLKALLGIAP